MTTESEPKSAVPPARGDAALEAARDDNARLRGELVRLSAERERLRVELSEARALEMVAHVAAGVAHDFSNLIMVIAGHSRLLLSRVAPDDALRASVEGIQSAAEWGGRLTHQLRAVCRKQASAGAVVNVNDIVAGADVVLRLLVGQANELVTRLDPEACPVRVSPGRLEQVIATLAANAREASPGGGRITIATARTDVDAAEAAVLGLPGAGRYVVLSVSDTGAGIDECTREPDVTIREPGTCSLGLATVRDIVARSGGAIHVAGSTFAVFLPLHAVGTGEVPGRPGTRPLDGRETVLVVEDERPVRELIRDVLRLHGYTVVEARDGSEAIALGACHAGPIHLLVLDVVTPGAPAASVAERLRAERPDLRQLYISGLPGEMLRERGIVRIGPDFLQKPFTVDALARKVREVLDRP